MMMMIQNRHHRKSNHNNRREPVGLLINDNKQQDDDVAAVTTDASDTGNIPYNNNDDDENIMGGNKLEKRVRQQQHNKFYHHHRNRKNVIVVIANGLMIICSICLIILWTFHFRTSEFIMTTTTSSTSTSSSSPAAVQLQQQNFLVDDLRTPTKIDEDIGNHHSYKHNKHHHHHQQHKQPKNGESEAKRPKKEAQRKKSSSSSSTYPDNTTTTTTSLIGSSVSSFSSANDDDGPPPSLIVHGKRSKYTPCPIQYRKHAYVQGRSKMDSYNIHRAFQSQGWFVTSEENNLYSPQQHIIYQKSKIKSNNTKTINFQPYQRYSRLTQFIRYIDSKDGFVAGFRKYQQKYEKSLLSTKKQKHKKKKKEEEEQQQQVQRSLDNSSNNKNMNDNMNINNNTISTTTTNNTNTNTKNKKNLIYFLPETYRLGITSDRVAFQHALEEERLYGIYKPWVLKQTRKSRGRGVEILPPNSPTLYEAIERTINDESNNYIVQAYVCNELVWYGGEKFDLRFYWMVASIDPLIVLFHDGFVRVADSLYNETDFLNTKQHLTNTAINKGGGRGRRGYHHGGGESSAAVAGSSRFNNNSGGGGGDDGGGSNSSIVYNNEEDVLADALWERIRQHYKENEVRLSKRISNSIKNKKKSTTTTTEDPSIITSIDPVRHVRNQLKDAISTTAAAFKDVLTADVRRKNTTTTTTTKITAENRFAIYGCDFIIDADLDVYYVEAQNGPQMKDTHDFRIDLYRKMLRPMVNLVEEIAIKQQTNAKANLLPLQNLGEWEIVYAGSNWRYKYQGYQRNLKDKKGCSS